MILRTEAMDQADQHLEDIWHWMATLDRPTNMHNSEYKHFLRRVQKYFIRGKWLWKCNSHRKHKMVLVPSWHLPIMEQTHDRLGHKGIFATMAHILEQIWWPFMHDDIKWYVQVCHLCQTQQVQNVLIPLMITVPAPIFVKVYMDSVHMPKSNGFKNLVQGQCSWCIIQSSGCFDLRLHICLLTGSSGTLSVIGVLFPGLFLTMNPHLLRH